MTIPKENPIHHGATHIALNFSQELVSKLNGQTQESETCDTLGINVLSS